MIIREQVLTSRQNPTVKWLSALSSSKGRKESRVFLAEGRKLTAEALSCGLPIQYLIVDDSKKESISDVIRLYEKCDVFDKTEIIFVSNDVFMKISTEKAPEGIISVIKYLDFYQETDIINKEVFETVFNNRILALCSLQDPLNVGAVIRSAAAFGVEQIVLSADSADVFHPKCVRASMASLFHVRLTVVKDFSSFIEAAKACNRRVLAAELRPNAVSLEAAKLQPSDIVVIGNEGHGISEEISKLCTSSVFIPICDGIESLNASVAAAVFMWEQKRYEG